MNIQNKILVFFLFFVIAGIRSKSIEAQSNNLSTSKTVQLIQPMIEITAPHLSIPVGYVARRYKIGTGFGFGFHFMMPFKKPPKIPFELRIGLQTGMNFYIADRGMIMINPWYPELIMLFPTKVADPYLRFGGGVSVSSFFPSQRTLTLSNNTVSKKTSLDGLLAFGLGSFFNLPQTKMVKLMLEMRVLTVFEQKDGIFLTFAFGVALRFGQSSVKQKSSLKSKK